MAASAALAAGVASASAACATNAPVKWSTTFTGAGIVRFSKPVLADLDGDGKLWVIFASEGSAATGGQGQLYVLNPHDGTVRAGWPRSMPLPIVSSPAVGDLLGDGGLEIVVGSGPNAQLDVQASVTAFHKDGTVLWTFLPPATSPISSHVVSSPAIGDLNGDGKEDVVFGSFNQYVYALDGPTGNPLPGWPVFVRDSVWSSPALADLDGSGHLEIIIGSEAHAEGTPINSIDGGALWVFRPNGSNFPGFPKYLAPIGLDSSPAVGDIDGDGCPEIVIGTTSSGNQAGGRVLYAFHNDGSPVSGWPVTLDGHTFTSPLLVDLNGDGTLDVVENDDTGQLYALRGNGTQIFKMQPKTITGQSAVVAYEMAAAQIGANNPVLLLGGVGFDVTLVSKAGVQLSENGSHGAGMLTYTTLNEVQGPAVGDLENTGTLNIVAASGTNDGTNNDAHVVVWNAGSVGALPWPMFRRDREHHASASPPHACPRVPPQLAFFTVPPCRISDSRNPGNLTYGGPSLMGGEVRTLTVPGVCNIPQTAKAVSLNVTVTGPSAGGFATFYPGGDGNPGTSTINYTTNRTLANNTVVPLSFDGLGHLTMQIGMPAGSHVDVIVDTNGYFQ